MAEKDATYENEAAHVPYSGGRGNEIEEETDTVLLDVGAAKLEGGAYGTLKLAKDGHVC